MTDVRRYECSPCLTPCLSNYPSGPKGWGIIESKLVCEDCLSWFNSPPVPVALTASAQTAAKGVERFFAITRPKSQGVTLFFDKGSVELTLDESEAIAAALAGANKIARGEHGVQPGGSK